MMGELGEQGCRLPTQSLKFCMLSSSIIVLIDSRHRLFKWRKFDGVAPRDGKTYYIKSACNLISILVEDIQYTLGESPHSIPKKSWATRTAIEVKGNAILGNSSQTTSFSRVQYVKDGDVICYQFRES